jgi:predicted nuclease of predicted toxin-antitoxin system
LSDKARLDMLRYFFDEHIKSAIAEQLRQLGIDVLTAQFVGRAGIGIPDEDQLAYATSMGRVLVTEDRDFISLAHTQLPHTGVAMLQRALSIGEYVEYLELLARTTEPDEMRNQLLYCDW